MKELSRRMTRSILLDAASLLQEREGPLRKTLPAPTAMRYILVREQHIANPGRDSRCG